MTIGAEPNKIVGFGELLVRLSPPDRRLIVQAQSLGIEIGGAEANVLAGLAALGHATAMVSVVADNPLGRLAIATLRARDVDTRFVARSADTRMGLYFLEVGAGVRASTITYDRVDSAFAKASTEDFDFAAALSGARLLHLSGITPALGIEPARAALAAVCAARQAGVPISFDGNYRAQLWERWDSDPRTTLGAIVEHVDILFGNHRDVALLLGRAFDQSGPEWRREAAQAAFEAYPRLTMIASTARTVIDVDEHAIAARVDTRTACEQTDTLAVRGIVDRIGTGDAFAAGVLNAWLRGGDCASMAQAGLTLAALKHSLPGDMTIFDDNDLAAVSRNAFDVRR